MPQEKVTIPKEEYESLKAKIAALEERLRATHRASSGTSARPLASVPGDGTLPFHQGPRGAAPDNGATHPPDAPDDGGRMLSDPDGTARYLGETSGATFLDQLKQFMRNIFPLVTTVPGSPLAGSSFLASTGSYQTFDSRPLLEPEHVEPLWLPSRPEMSSLLARLRHFAQDGMGSYPSGGIYFWSSFGTLPSDPRQASGAGIPSFATLASLPRHRDLALYHAAFAIATQCTATTGLAESGFEQPSEAFFSRARALLGNTLDFTAFTMSNVSALALMGFYLLEMNRRDAAYIYVSLAVHLSIMHGVHRNWVVNEQGKRAFWTIYILDR